MENLDIFNLSADSLVTKVNSKGEKDLEFYKPYPENGKDGVYKALIRFVPNPVDPSKSKIHKYYVYLNDPISGESFPVDCPSTVGKKSILKDVFWKLKNSHSAADQEMAKSFSRKEDFYALVQIVQDKNSPELEGKIMMFKFGKKLNDMIEAQLKPEYGDPSNPFDLFNGREFALQVRKVGEWNNYDLCSFVGNPSPIKIEGIPMERNERDMKKIVDYLNEGPKNLGSFEYKDWDDATSQRVMSVIRNTVPDGRIVNEVIGGVSSAPSTPSNNSYSGYTSPVQSYTTQQDPEPRTQATSESISDFNDFYSEASNTRTSSDTSTSTPPSSQGGISSLDDLYADL
jgi:hypothetical protein